MDGLRSRRGRGRQTQQQQPRRIPIPQPQQQQQARPGERSRLRPRWIERFQSRRRMIETRPEFHATRLLVLERQGPLGPRIISVHYPGGLIVVGTDAQIVMERNNRIAAAVYESFLGEDTDSDATVILSSTDDDDDDASPPPPPPPQRQPIIANGF